MPYPVRYETWLAEAKLEPWVHFLPVKHDCEEFVAVLPFSFSSLPLSH